jgi:hypothetical protein
MTPMEKEELKKAFFVDFRESQILRIRHFLECGIRILKNKDGTREVVRLSYHKFHPCGDRNIHYSDEEILGIGEWLDQESGKELDSRRVK